MPGRRSTTSRLRCRPIRMAAFTFSFRGHTNARGTPRWHEMRWRSSRLCRGPARPKGKLSMRSGRSLLLRGSLPVLLLPAGCWLAGSTSDPAPVLFEDAAARAHVNFTLRNSGTPDKHQIETMGGGVAVFDYN